MSEKIKTFLYKAKEKWNKFYEKVKSKKIYYASFVIVVLFIAWYFLGSLGLTVALIYFIQKINFVKRQFLKLKNNRQAAGITIAVTTAIMFGLVFGFSQLVKSMIQQGMASYVPQPTAVTSVLVKEQDWQPIINTIGEAQAIQSTAISSQSGGIISEIAFKSGQEVKKGDLLFKLDTSQLEASLEEAQANLKLAKITDERYKQLVAQRATSKESADKANADYLSAKAQVDNIRSQIAFKVIRAPFDGRIGIRNINLGQYFNNGDNAATLTTISPIFITFPIPQNKVNLIKVGDVISFYSDTFPNETFEAKITAVNSFINSSNRSIMAQAIYKNKDHRILPGMFVTVHINLPIEKNAIVIPRNAINYNLYGESVYTLKTILDDDGKPTKASYTSTADGGMKTVQTEDTLYKVGQDNIEVLETKDNLALVSGVKAGETIVTSGQNKIRKGAKVIVNNSVELSNDIYNEDIQ